MKPCIRAKQDRDEVWFFWLCEPGAAPGKIIESPPMQEHTFKEYLRRRNNDELPGDYETLREEAKAKYIREVQQSTEFVLNLRETTRS